MTQDRFESIRAAAYALILLPVMIANLRTRRITNMQSGLVLIAGVVLVVAERLLTGAWNAAPLFWAIMATAILLLAALRVLPGGGAKFLIALLPWFANWGAFAVVVTIAFFATAAVGYARGGESPLVPSFYVAGLGALIYVAL
jgi:hypothetical protein